MSNNIDPCFVSSYVPKKCGIATFVQNLFVSYQSLYDSTGRIVAIDDQVDRDFPPEVSFVFDRNKASDYIKAAEYINSTDLSVVNLQHEFGLFGGPEGRLITTLLEKLNKPIVTTVHTVLQAPNLGYYTSLMEVIHHSDRVVALSYKAEEILKEVYHVNPKKIVMIPHGVPDLPFSDPESFKTEFGTQGRFVLLTFGLLSPGKGIETVLEALPGVVRDHPEVLYIIMGKTHPDVVRLYGESYRESLQKIVNQYSLEDNVLFIDKFLSNEELFNHINGSDIYITPYLSPEQISSGTLAYAVGLGKVIISTPYWYAEELLADGRGCLIPFRNSKALTNTLNELLSSKENLNKMRSSAYAYGREMIWSRVSERYQDLFKEVYKEHAKKGIRKVSAIRKSTMDNLRIDNVLNMFERITDDTGIFQFTKYGIPDWKNGYSSDDIGRALEVVMKLVHEENRNKPVSFEEYRLSKKYLSFLYYVQKKDGKFHNFVSFDRRYLDETGSEDTFGRCLAGLGSTIALCTDQSLTLFAKEIFDRAIDSLPTDRSWSSYPRALAYSICGLYGYLQKYPESPKVTAIFRFAADRLIEFYKTNNSTDWHWFEQIIVYGNAKIPYSLMLAYNAFKDKSYLDIALKTLDFLTSILYNGVYFDLIGNQGWLHKGGPKACFDQQPIEIGYLVEAYCEALRLTWKKEYRTLAKKAFNWFFGNNRLGIPVYNVVQNYPLDGLGASGSNNNSGAEAVISFALAATSLNDIKISRTIGKKGKGDIIIKKL